MKKKLAIVALALLAIFVLSSFALKAEGAALVDESALIEAITGVEVSPDIIEYVHPEEVLVIENVDFIKIIDISETDNEIVAKAVAQFYDSAYNNKFDIEFTAVYGVSGDEPELKSVDIDDVFIMIPNTKGLREVRDNPNL
ncbi:MAG: hypothetical protein LBC41_16810 [Clostridiales bacterium]|jgi:hypothetical protein|nr:hypothetical protein [Clostridiales bacterium]MDR2752319.1 hypothetical protein [Clostridiales bacterium]